MEKWRKKILVERLGKWKELYKKDLNKIKSVKTGNEELIGIKKSYTQSILLTMTMSMISDEWWVEGTRTLL